MKVKELLIEILAMRAAELYCEPELPWLTTRPKTREFYRSLVREAKSAEAIWGDDEGEA